MDEQSDADAATGDPHVDEALRTLRLLDERPVHEHAALVESVHRALQERLAADDEPHPTDEEG